MLLRARFSGGECTGTLNGEDYAGPATPRARLYGPQSCAGGVTEGRFSFTIGGRRITGDMTYRRTGSRVNALWQGDAGGSALVLVRAQVGLVSEDDPFAQTPVIGPSLAGRYSTAEVLARCAAEGIPRMPIAVDRIQTLQPLSG